MKPSCPYCGNNPVPHKVFWFTETLNIVLTPPRQVLLYNPLTRFAKTRGWDASFSRGFLAIGEGLGIVRRQSDVTKCKVRRAQVLWEEGEKRGIEMGELVMWGKPIDVYVAGKNVEVKMQNAKSVVTLIFSGLPRPAGYSNNWLDLMDDKGLFKKKLLENGLPVPAGGWAANFNQAKKIFNGIKKPVIVKPRSGSRGRHSTTFVNSEGDLKQAVKIAKQLCHWVIVEEQLTGPVYRATVINFQLEGVLRGDSPQVVGDGESNISQLIKQKNSAPHPGVKDIIINFEMETFLARQNLALSSAPTKGQAVMLSEKIGVNYGGSSSEDFDVCHPDNKELFEKAAKVLGDPIVGFDFIIPDITKSWKRQACGFIEVNSLPFINLHHDPLHGTPRNVAAKVWEMMGW